LSSEHFSPEFQLAHYILNNCSGVAEAVRARNGILSEMNFPQNGNFKIRWPEIIAPLRYAMSFINGQQAKGSAATVLPGRVGVEILSGET
jgi:hypothetical protein